MNPLAVPILPLTGITLFVGIIHLLIYFRMRNTRFFLTFSFMSFAMAAYQIFSVGLYNSTSVSESIFWQRGQVTSICIIAITFSWFIMDYLNKKINFVIYLFSGFFIIMAFFQIFDRSTLTWDIINPSIKIISLPFNIQMIYHEAATGLLTEILYIVGMILYVYILWIAVISYKSGNKVRGKLLIYSVLLFFCGVINDALVSSGFNYFIYIGEYTFLGIIFMMVKTMYNELLTATAIKNSLKENEESFKNIVEMIPYPIVLIDKNENFEYINAKFTETFGYTITDIPTTAIWFKKAYPNKNYRETVLKTWNPGKFYADKKILGHKEFKVTCKNNTKRIVLFRIVTIAYRKKLVIFDDLTDKKKVQDETLKASKIESLGVFAGGIAHDFNNLLTAVIGNISLAKTNTEKNSEIFEILSDAENASQRTRDLTQQLLTFSKGGLPVKKTASIKQLLTDTAQFVLSGTKFKKTFNIADDLLNTVIDAGQINQVLHNILLNARQSMGDKGTITISAENITVDSSVNLPIKEGNYVKVIISDQGVGISAVDLKNIFDPYFTTKHNGSGLGLSISYSIIRKHDGHITVASEEGKGTSFEIYLPATDERPTKKTVMDFYKNSSESKILLMDDDNAVLTVAEKMLIKLGCSVVLATEGNELLDIYYKHHEEGNPFDLIIMDLTIPGGLGGKETNRILQERFPGVKVVVSSGYSNDPVMAAYKDYGFTGIIKKPYKFEELSETIQAVLSD